MSKPLGSVIDGYFIFKKNGVLADPSVAPTIIVCAKPDGTTVTPDSLAHLSTGIYYADQLFSALDTATLTGNYTAIAETTDTTMDWQTWLAEQDIANISTPAVIAAAVWDYLKTSANTANSIGKYFVDSFTSLLAAITSAVRTVTSPVTDNLDIEVEQNDTYYLADGRQLAFTIVGGP